MNLYIMISVTYGFNRLSGPLLSLFDLFIHFNLSISAFWQISVFIGTKHKAKKTWQ